MRTRASRECARSRGRARVAAVAALAAGSHWLAGCLGVPLPQDPPDAGPPGDAAPPGPPGRTEYARVTPSIAAHGDFFGHSVALSGDLLAIGAYGEDSAATGVDGDQDDDAAPDTGAVYVFRRSGASWVQEAYIKPSSTGGYKEFGKSVALSGDTLAVGAPSEGNSATGVNGDESAGLAGASGAVYVFRRSGTSWRQEAYVKASNTGDLDHFGHSVALSGDTLAVGAFAEDSSATGIDGNQGDDSFQTSGAVYVFRRSGTSWAQEAYVKASNTGRVCAFGWSVALADDTLAVGAPLENRAATGIGDDRNPARAPHAGAAYVFRRTGTTWVQEAYIKASNTDSSDSFGSSVALSGDTLAVGAPGEDSAAAGVGGDQDDDSAERSGAAFVFRRSGTSWQQEAYIKASNPAEGDNFGEHLALAGDTLAIGARFKHGPIPILYERGAAYLFRRSGTTWQQAASLEASDAQARLQFGVALAATEDDIAVGTEFDADYGSDDRVPGGTVYLFR